MKWLIIAVILLTGCTYISSKVATVKADKVGVVGRGDIKNPDVLLNISRCYTTFKKGCRNEPR